MNISEFDYELPEELIAQMPADKRENSKMLVLNRESQTIEHKKFYQPDFMGIKILEQKLKYFC